MKRIALLTLLSNLIGITAILIIASLQIDPILAKTTDSWYDLEKKKNWEVAGPFKFGIKIPSNWAWEKVYYEPENMINWHQNNAIQMFPNNLENQSAVFGLIALDEFFAMNNAALNTYINYKKQTPDWLPLSKEFVGSGAVKLLSENDMLISDQPGKKLEYQTALNYKIAMYLTIFNGEPYIAIYQAKAPLYDQYINEFETILQSITWIEEEDLEETEDL